MTIGVLALQGGFQSHLTMLEQLGVDAIPVRYAQQLADCAGLILPGGESTTMTRLLESEGLWAPVASFVKSHPVFGTCAGAILLSKDARDERVKPFGVLDMVAERNAYGRQVDSFSAPLDLCGIGAKEYTAVFIRAPQLTHTSESVDILATENGKPVLVRQGMALAATFHPELTADPAIHRYFIESVVPNQKTIADKKVVAHV
ncbi:MAG: pyridoxal 5'-phosphate synthase glutaminase subunit PdxT [Candidatus Marinimicrobia bacterium]|nr:pyridoxal 5'-phosphate synthase glutaminase subunit PdxT [Candidatus Neomarinimicrobiota bacterium]MCF7839589.1 pyridoxal 5'-phosphate synthase glutaminase subunit PdxT [Candidatus Neomarinimicrobiota bacterium]